MTRFESNSNQTQSQLNPLILLANNNNSNSNSNHDSNQQSSLLPNASSLYSVSNINTAADSNLHGLADEDDHHMEHNSYDILVDDREMDPSMDLLVCLFG